MPISVRLRRCSLPSQEIKLLLQIEFWRYTIKKQLIAILTFLGVCTVFVTFSHAGWNPNKSEKANDHNVKKIKVDETITNFKNTNSNMEFFLKRPMVMPYLPR